MNEVVKKCILCDVNLVQVNLKGTSLPWKDFPNVIVIKDLFVLGCPECGEKIMRGNEISNLDDILKLAIKEETSILLNELKEKSGLNQKEISKYIGISEVYLSKLIGKKTIPSFEKFNYLRLLNQYPKYLIEKISVGNKATSSKNTETNIIDLSKYTYLTNDEKTNYSPGSKFCRIFENRQV